MNKEEYKVHLRKKNGITLFFFIFLSVVLFFVGFIRVSGDAKAELKKTTFKSLNDVFLNKNPMKKDQK